MKKLALFPIALLFACLLAGLYGAIHNQISYSVGPSYFYDFKFDQFRIASEWRNRWGASAVGWRASWWMGLIIGLPIYFACLFVKGINSAVKTYLTAALLVICLTLATGLGALLHAFITISADALPSWANQRSGVDLGFARAGQMHNFSYLGGLVGLIIGFGFTIIRAILSHRRSQY